MDVLDEDDADVFNDPVLDQLQSDEMASAGVDDGAEAVVHGNEIVSAEELERFSIKKMVEEMMDFDLYNELGTDAEKIKYMKFVCGISPAPAYVKMKLLQTAFGVNASLLIQNQTRWRGANKVHAALWIAEQQGLELDGVELDDDLDVPDEADSPAAKRKKLLDQEESNVLQKIGSAMVYHFDGTADDIRDARALKSVADKNQQRMHATLKKFALRAELDASMLINWRTFKGVMMMRGGITSLSK